MATIFGKRYRFSPRSIATALWLLEGFFPLLDVFALELSGCCYQSHFSEAVPATWSVLICLF